MNHQAHLPSPDLLNVVRQYWTLEFGRTDTPRLNTIIPDGTVKLIFHYGDPYYHHPQGSARYLQPKCFFTGPLTRPYVVEPAGDTGTFVVQFCHDGFLPFASLPLHEVVDTPVPLTRLFGSEAPTLEAQILGASSTSERVSIMEQFLRRLLLTSPAIDQLVANTIHTIVDARGVVHINDLADAAALHRRHFLRRFQRATGFSPKQLAKTVKLRGALQSLSARPADRLTDIAYASDYYDQSHFIRDFRQLTGLTPKAFFGERLSMSRLID